MELFIIGEILAFNGMMPDILVKHAGMTPGTAGLFASMASWATLPGVIAGSWLSDKLGLRRKIVLSGMFANAVFLLAIGFLIHTFIPLFIVIILSGFCIGISIPLIRTIVVELKEIRPILSGSAYGAIFTFNRLGGFVIPWLMGIILDIDSSSFPRVCFPCSGGSLSRVAIYTCERDWPSEETRRVRAFLGEEVIVSDMGSL